MALTWKDFVTTVLALAVFGVYYAMIKDINLPFIGGYRSAVLLLAVIGVMMCAFSGASDKTNGNIFIVLASILGVAALAFIVYGLITGTKLALILLSSTIIALWVITTIHHFVGSK